MGQKPTLDLKDVRRKLKKLGFINKSGSKHKKWVGPEGQIVSLSYPILRIIIRWSVGPEGQIVSLSYGNQDIRQTLLKFICSQAQIEISEFLKI